MSDVFDTQEEPRARSSRQQVINEQLVEDEFIRNALKNRTGRKFFWRWLERLHIFEVSYVQGSFDSTAFREGERSIGNRLLADIVRVAPESYIEMMKEHQPKRKKEEAEDAA